MTHAETTIVTSAGDRWRAMIEAEHAQSARLADPGWQAPADPFAAHVASFRAARTRADDPVLVALLAGVQAGDVLLDVGAGAGRLALPLAAHVREVVAIEPSLSMGAALIEDARRAGLTNIRHIPTRWEDAPPLAADVAFAAHMGYTTRPIEALLLRLDHAAHRWAMMVVFVDPPQHRLFPVWPAVHGEERLPLPHLPQLLAVLTALGRAPEVTTVHDALWPLGPWATAQEKLRRRLFLEPGSAADRRLEEAMAAHLTDWGGGVLGPRDRRPLDMAIVRWRPGPAGSERRSG